MRPALGLPGLRLGKPPGDGFRDVGEASRTGQHAPEFFGLTDDLLISGHGSMLVDVRAHRQLVLTLDDPFGEGSLAVGGEPRQGYDVDISTIMMLAHS